MLFKSKEVTISEQAFIVKDRDQYLKVEEWGRDTVRVTCYPDHKGFDPQHGMEELEKNGSTTAAITATSDRLTLTNNRMTVVYDGEKLTFYNNGIKILEEYSRKQSQVRRTVGIDAHIPIPDEPTSSLNISPREFTHFGEHAYQATLRFEGDPDEKLYGMGGYQEENLDKNGGTYELLQRNSQTTIPFYLSDKQYGFIWNNAAIGEVTFGRNQKIWKSNNTTVIDYLVTVGENPKQVIENYTQMTGRTPRAAPELLGLWQSKLRYQTLDELRTVYQGYRQRGIALSVLVIDYYHWTADGDFTFDSCYWDGIEVFAEEIKATGTQLMVSLWPTVTEESRYYQDYRNNQLLIRSITKKDTLFAGKALLDFFHPETKTHLRQVLDENYRRKGISLFWADQAEPEMDTYQHKEYLVYDGNLEKYANKYPFHYLQAIQADPERANTAPTLIRSAWFNSQKYGTLAWSGDIESSFASLRKQIKVGLCMGISGIAWWTSDIGGFHSGNSQSPRFKKLMIRWFQFAVFSPILRMHGDRQPHTQKIGTSGGGIRTSGGPNEIWSFGEEVEDILTHFTHIRTRLKNYITDVYDESATTGLPIMRCLFLEFPNDPKAWEETSAYLFGSDLLVAPVVAEGVTHMPVYLPKGCNWIHVFTKEVYPGGQTYNIAVTFDTIPVFCKEGAPIEYHIEEIFEN